MQATAWKCPSCAGALRQARSFASSSISKQQIGPESPKYIDLPQPYQAQRISYPKKKGFLPVPRDIFSKHKGGINKVTEEYLAAATKQAQRPLGSSNEEQAAFNDWRTRMAVSRKQNLRTGLQALQDRRKASDEHLRRQAEKKHIERQALLSMKEREDEQLTGPTISSLMQSGIRGSVLPDPARAQRVAEMAARVRDKEAQRADQRLEALHTLYVNAKDFIVSEAQLDQHIDEVFGTVDRPAGFGPRGSSIWARGPPSTIQSKLNRASKSRVPAGQEMDSDAQITVTRIGKIAEALTGGKMG